MLDAATEVDSIWLRFPSESHLPSLPADSSSSENWRRSAKLCLQAVKVSHLSLDERPTWLRVRTPTFECGVSSALETLWLYSLFRFISSRADDVTYLVSVCCCLSLMLSCRVVGFCRASPGPQSLCGCHVFSAIRTGSVRIRHEGIT